MACSDDLYMPASSPAEGQPLRFEVTVIDQPETRGQVMNVNDNYVTRDFKAGDSFGMFIIDDNNQFVSTIDDKNAKNLKLTTPDGKAWNLNSDLKEVVHKLGYKYVAYYPYSPEFDNCSSIDDIQTKLTAPAEDQSAQAAIDWMYTEPTPPGVNAVTVLKFNHRYAKIEIFNSFTQEHRPDWSTKYLFTKTIDENKVEHYRYIINQPSATTLSVSGKYSIGNDTTGIKELSYSYPDIAVKNGRHAIVYTYGMDERCAVDLGLPSGVRWSPINLGTESGTYMTDDQLAAAANKLGKRLAWGELFEKDTYTYDSYINDPYLNGTSTALLPWNISETAFDPVRQYWGGHWTLPSTEDIQEFIDNTEIAGMETISASESETGKEMNRITFRSKRNGNTITMLTNGYVNNSTIYSNQNLYYMSANRSSYANGWVLTGNNPYYRGGLDRRYGICVRPVLKERYTYLDADKKGIIVRHIDDLAVDLGITKTVTENGEDVTYKLLWSPFNYGVESKVELHTYNQAPINDSAYIEKCKTSPGMRLAWGDTEERDDNTKFTFEGYANSEMAKKDYYNKNNTASTDKDTRDLRPEDDIVRLNWPEGWSIPTARDLELLASNTSVTTEKDSNGKTWFRLTSKTKGNSILIPGTWYIDNNYNKETWGTTAFLQSSTMGISSTSVKGELTGKNVTKRTIYALSISGNSANLSNSAGRATGLMIRPVKYVRVQQQ